MRLPSGTVTFVFTDIEGSTHLIRNLGDGYASALDRHREILREAWDRYGGHEINTRATRSSLPSPLPMTR